MTAKAYEIIVNPKYGFRQVTPTPSDDECAEYYAKEFYSAAYPRFHNAALESQLDDELFLTGHRDDMCATLATLLGRPLEGLEVLDIGCGWGQLLIYCKNRGMACFGIDPAPEAVEYGRGQGLTVELGDVGKPGLFSGRQFDVVFLITVLEHLPRPIEALTDILTTVLRPGGILVVEVPNDFNPLQETAVDVLSIPEWWVAPPAHLNYFTPESLRETLTQVGFAVRHVEATFPLELFLLFGENYVTDKAIGKSCHRRRVAFEVSLRRTGRTRVLRDFYNLLAKAGLGRTTVAFAQRTE